MADSKVVPGLEPGGAVLVLAQEEVEGHGLGRCDQQAASAWQGGLHIEGEARGEEQEGPSGCGGPGPFDEEGVPRGLAEEGSGHAILSRGGEKTVLSHYLSPCRSVAVAKKSALPLL